MTKMTEKFRPAHYTRDTRVPMIGIPSLSNKSIDDLGVDYDFKYPEWLTISTKEFSSADTEQTLKILYHHFLHSNEGNARKDADLFLNGIQNRMKLDSDQVNFFDDTEAGKRNIDLHLQRCVRAIDEYVSSLIDGLEGAKDTVVIDYRMTNGKIFLGLKIKNPVLLVLQSTDGMAKYIQARMGHRGAFTEFFYKQITTLIVPAKVGGDLRYDTRSFAELTPHPTVQ